MLAKVITGLTQGNEWENFHRLGLLRLFDIYDLSID